MVFRNIIVQFKVGRGGKYMIFVGRLVELSSKRDPCVQFSSGLERKKRWSLGATLHAGRPHRV